MTREDKLRTAPGNPGRPLRARRNDASVELVTPAGERRLTAFTLFSGTLLTQPSTCATAVSMVRSVVSSNSASVLGSIGATLRWPSRGVALREILRRDLRILAAIPLSINCLSRLRARISTLAVRNTLVDASGKTTVPMSRPSATRPGGRRKGPLAKQQRAAHGRQRSDQRRCGRDLLAANGVADFFPGERDRCCR
jgi:hypothetical protein